VTGGNRLPVLAAEVREAHQGVREAAKNAVERAIEAGRALIEAKSLLDHGQWLPWLKTHCSIPERTAQLYMRTAKTVDELGLKSATVADLGLRMLGKMEAGGKLYDELYDPFHHCDDEGERQWKLFILFGVDSAHVEWLLQRQFATPDDWIGEEGARFRRQWCKDPVFPDTFKASWAEFQREHAVDTMAELDAALSARQGAEP
jgi:hypothetical protein